LVGIVAIAVMYTLMGIIMIVRYDTITDFLIPLTVVAVVMQMAFLYFIGWMDSPILLLIPVSAPTMIMRGAYLDLTLGEWVYALGYTAVLLVGMSVWAYRAFEKHIIMDIG
jgi:fluoroquinolone transport system permease protein